MDWSGYTQGGMGAFIGSVITAFGFKNKIDNLERDQHEFKQETQSMFREIRDDIKKLLERK